MAESFLRVHHFEPSSRANGPGLRSVLWLQGCTLGCPGCFNPETHRMHSGQLTQVKDLFKQIQSQASRIEGLTISGGEPLLQKKPLTALLQRTRQMTNLSVVVFTGFEWPEVERMPGISALIDCMDVLIAGRYSGEQRIAHALSGSKNKSFHFFTPRYSPADFEEIPVAEVILKPDGHIHLSGIDPLDWQAQC